MYQDKKLNLLELVILNSQTLISSMNKKFLGYFKMKKL